jgi:hypothetical protein
MAWSREDQRAEVAAWQASGLSKGSFAAKRGYSRTALDKWSKREPTVAPAFVRLEIEAVQSELVVEVGHARIRIRRGFDVVLLGQVVTALAGASS